jgi:hypothetical protein
VTTAPLLAVALTTMFAGQLITGGILSWTVMIWVQDAELLQASTTV